MDIGSPRASLGHGPRVSFSLTTSTPQPSRNAAVQLGPTGDLRGPALRRECPQQQQHGLGPTLAEEPLLRWLEAPSRALARPAPPQGAVPLSLPPAAPLSPPTPSSIFQVQRLCPLRPPPPSLLRSPSRSRGLSWHGMDARTNE
nr:uncharacterized protein LOC131280719 [Dasypus novemcinctus]